ncbi:hypothetical protein HDU84_009883 [Entophlyctis sp. JEL0112]|nr:hypothetical protein HDU84_009883 [Entophlyctis sp. JEL0112]
MHLLLLSIAAASYAFADVPNAAGSACSGASYACSVSASDPQMGAIVQCVSGAFVHIDDCNDSPNNACTLIGGIPYCVLGNGIIGDFAVNVQVTAVVATTAAQATTKTTKTKIHRHTAPAKSQTSAVATTSSGCAGTLVTVQPGDLCETVASSHGATTSDIVFLNQDTCGGNFQNTLPVGAVLCVVPGIAANAGPTITADALVTANYLQGNSCSGHVDIVMTGASCDAIAQKYGISLAQLTAATIPGQCDDLEAADAICIP